MRPGVVWFGEALPDKVWQEAERAVGACEVLLVAGTSAVVYPAAGLIDMAREGAAAVIEVNLEETPYSAGVTISLLGRAGEILPELLRVA
jgi:NAD-dependent deacetylase